MRLEYTCEQEDLFRITEIQAILENDLYDNEMEESELISEMAQGNAQIEAIVRSDKT